MTRYWTLNSRKIWKKKSDEFALGCCLLLSSGGCSHEAAGGHRARFRKQSQRNATQWTPNEHLPFAGLGELGFSCELRKRAADAATVSVGDTPMIRCDKLRCQLSSCGQLENCHPASDVDQVNLGTDGTGKPRLPCSLLTWQCEGNHAFICIKDFPTTYTENLWMFHCLAPYVRIRMD